LIFADRDQERSAAEAAARSLGARLIGVESIENALERLGRQAAVDAVLIELGGSSAPTRDRLLEWANQAAREGAAAAVIACPQELIDEVYAHIEPAVMMLVDPTVEQRAAELALVLAGPRRRLHDHGAEEEADRLRRLSEEVARIAGALAELSSSRSAPPLAAREPAAPAEAPKPDAGMIRNLLRIRRLREQFFAPDLFADPAWDMLLDLMAARLEGGQVAVSSLCIAAAVPATTALRWIRTLTEHGLFVRAADPEDGRRIFIELSDEAADALTAYFQSAYQAGLRIV
jgi:DNA-binding MarR family transcriptional regulator